MLKNLFFLIFTLIFSSSIFSQASTPAFTTVKNTVDAKYALNDSEILLEDCIVVAPNPSATLIHITSAILPKDIELFDITGKFIHKSSSNKYVNLEAIDQGTYILKLHYDGFTAIKKVIKK